VPTYDYRCRDCGHTIEVIHPMSEEGPSACEVCGGPVRRVLFPAGIIFKGSGFYRNDSRKDGGSGASSRPAATKSGDAPGTTASDVAGGTTATKSESGAGDGGSSGQSKPPTPPPSAPAKDS
jgi:putative FmdB family regulatory protein